MTASATAAGPASFDACRLGCRVDGVEAALVDAGAEDLVAAGRPVELLVAGGADRAQYREESEEEKARRSKKKLRARRGLEQLGITWGR